MVFIAIFASILTNAQNFQWGRYFDGTFNNISQSSASDITSDFGMRNAGVGATVFHRGVDISPIGDEDVVIIAPFDGTITNIVPTNGGIKSLEFTSKIDTNIRIALLHIFSNDALPITSNGFRLQYVGAVPVIVDLVNCRAFSSTPGLQVYCNLAHPAILTTNEFDLGWPIAPMGNSGHIRSNTAYPYHTHVTQLENGSHDYNSLTDCIDAMHDLRISGVSAPLSTRIRRRDLAPAIDLNHDANCEHNGVWGVFTPSYDNKTRNVVEIEVSMLGAAQVAGKTDRYSNGFMNESLIEAKISKSGTNNFALIQGSEKLSKFRMDPRGAEVIYPGTNYGGIGVNNAGCSPYAYTEDINFHPHDYYLSPDFYLRIHKGHNIGSALKLADYPSDARYTDGDYQIMSQVTNIDGVTNAGTPVNFDIDNFKPYVSEASVNFEQIGASVYWNKWSPTSVASQLELGTRGEGGIPNLQPGPLTVYAKLSETMQWVNAEIPTWSNTIVAGVLVDPAENKWKFSFNSFPGLDYGQCHKIYFRGKDLNGNDLLDFQIEAPGIPNHCNWGITKKGMIPKRDGVNSWDATTASGTDAVHRFRILKCGPMQNSSPALNNNIDCEMLSQAISSDVHFADAGQSNGSITLSVAGNPSGILVTWYDAKYNMLGEGLSLANLLPGWYCYELKQECCVVSDCIEVGACSLTAKLTRHHPSGIGMSDGSITATPFGGNEPLTYHWSNGATTSEISGLAIGTYTVTVSDVFHCSAVASATLIDCPVITATPQVIVSLPSACDASDGGIKVLEFHANGGVAPYSYYWKDEAGNIIAPQDFHGVPAGVYCLIAEDALGCTGSKCYDLIPEYFPIVEADISPSCTGQSNGKISVSALSQPPGYFTFSWDDGVVEFGGNLSERYDLSAGTYCVTISSEENDCTVERCYEVPSVTPNGPLSETHSIVHPCPNAANGQINMTITGGVEPYLIDWVDLFYLNEPEDRTGLGAGVYKVKIKDYCGTEIFREFNLIPVSIFKTFAYPGCPNQGQAEVVPSSGSGNFPYTITWSNGAHTYNVNNLPSGETCVSVTDAKGCVASKCFQLTNNGYTVSVTTPCVGMSDGVISVHVNNPNNGAVTVHLDGTLVYSNPFAPAVFTVDIPSLTGGTTYNVDVTIEDCLFSTSVIALGTKPVEQVFDHYNDPDNECVYNDQCNGNIIPGSQTIEAPFFDLANSISNLTECKTPIYCRERFIENMDFNKYWVRAAEYELILLEAFNLFPNAAMAARLEEFYQRGLDACDKVRYCSADMEIGSVLPTAAPNQDPTYLGDGCYALDCTPAIPWEDNDFCITDEGFYPPIFDIAEPHDLGESCNPAMKNLYQLILWEEDLKAAFPVVFENSVLYNEYIKPNREDPRAKCASVIFCQRDFSVTWSNFSTISCDDYPMFDDQGPVFGGFTDCGAQNFSNDCIVFHCWDPSSSNYLFHETNPDDPEEEIDIYGSLVRVCSEYPGHFFTSPGGNDEFIKTNTGCTDGELVNFGTAVSEGRRFPKGVTRCDGHYNFLDYIIPSRVDPYVTMPDADYLIDDWDTQQTVLVRTIQNEKSYSVDCHGDVTWSRLLYSNTRLKVSYFEKEGNEYVIGGEFLGNLSFESTQITTQNVNSGFIIRVSTQGALLNYNIIRNLEPQKPLVFVRGADGAHIVGRSTDQPLTLDGTAYSVQSGYLTDVQPGANGGSTLSGNVVAFDTSLTLVRAERSLDNSRISYLLRGTGRVKYNGQQIIGSSAQDLLVVTCNNAGNVLWAEPINGQNIVGQDFDLAYGAGNNVVVGLTYNNSMTIQGHQSVSNGSTDVLLVRFNGSGQVAGMLNYGTAKGENVSKMFFADSVLYFGGEFAGSSSNRTIGSHSFVTTSNAVSTPYLSFVTESNFPQNGGRMDAKPREDAQFAKPISVYPNPFSNDLTLRIESTVVERVSFSIFDGLGNLITEQQQQAHLGVNEYPILTQQYPNGVYLIKVNTESGQSWIQKVVKN